MKKILLFPYHPDMQILVRYRRNLKDVRIVGFYSYREDETEILKLNQLIGSTGSFEEMLLECNQVILLENYRGCEIKKYYEVIEKAIACGRTAALVPQLKNELESEKLKGCTFLTNEFNLNLSKPLLRERTKYPVELPVLAVFGMGKNCCKFENQICLNAILEKAGYRAAWISSNPLGVLFGAVTLPDFLFEETIPFEEKVFRLNHLLFRISNADLADVCIIGVPEGISQFEKYEFHHFAEYALVIGNAVNVDGAVLCTYFLEDLSVEGIKELMFHSGEKFGFLVDLVSIGTSGFQMMDGELDIVYLYLSRDFVKRQYTPPKELPEYIAGIWEKDRIENALKRLTDRLTKNLSAV